MRIRRTKGRTHGVHSSGSSASTDCRGPFCRTTAVPSDLLAWQGFPGCRCDPARYSDRADRARTSRAERRTRADAQDAQRGDDPPAGADDGAAAKRFDEFRHIYNDERPHETLGQKRPVTIYRPSPRPYPEALPPIEYAGHLETRKVEHNGMMRWKNDRIFTSKTLRGEYVGLEEIDDGIWSVYYGPVLLARFDEREMRFYG